VEALIRPDDIHEPPTGLICMENARGNGQVVTLESMRAVKGMAQRHGIPVHLDGARIFNAALALGVTAADIAACTDSVMFCLSKGLCAPVGSIVAGSSDFIRRARRCRKRMGGGLRQAGILAAAGIWALEHMVDRLAEDHENARALAGALAAIDGVKVERDCLDINMVFFTLPEEIISTPALCEGLKERGIKAQGWGGSYRFVTNHGVEAQDLPVIAQEVREVICAYNR
jgi:threonine aldolase